MSAPIDTVTEARFKLLYPDVVTRALRLYDDIETQLGHEPRCAQGLRTYEDQAKLYAQGRTTPGPIVTNSKPGFTIHHFGAAIDTCFIGPDPFLEKMPPAIANDIWTKYGLLAEGHGFAWGGRFKSICDRPHIQLTYGLSIQDLRDLYAHGGLKAVWAKFDQLRGVPQGSEWDQAHSQTIVTAMAAFPDEESTLA